MSIKIDDDKIISESAAQFRARYGLYREDSDTVTTITTENEKDFKIQKFGHVCLALLSSHVKAYKKSLKTKLDPNRLILYTHFNLGGKHLALNLAERRWWAKKCLQHKLFPQHTDVKHYAKTGRLVINLTDLSSTGLFMHFCAARIPQENSYMVKTVRYLVMDKRIDFFIALLIACKWGSAGPGHSLLPTYRHYAYQRPTNVGDVEVDLREARGLRRLGEKIRNGEIKAENKFSMWRLHDNITRLGKKTKMTKIKDVKTKEALDFVNGDEV